ncbi:uncharacterized protein LOC118438136 [Folsomia candida]|uniref:uncharacterized protein LOC118438136 n=1 Tax=Folsomia candida TaxID=158441 RepID=UPI001604A7CB|nr:uncharacterized protein LOC118438136 [Folsomia candida]
MDTSPLNNRLILSNVLKFVPPTTLQTARFVCKLWDYEAAKCFAITIFITPSTFKQSKARNLIQFVEKYQVEYNLQLSFLPKSLWTYINRSQFFEGLYDHLYNQVINVSTGSASSIMDLLSGTLQLVRDLRLETMVRNEQEGKLLSRLFHGMPGLKTLSLDLLDWTEEGLKHLCRKVPFSLDILGLHFHNKDLDEDDLYAIRSVELEQNYHPLLDNWISTLLPLFNTIKFLDARGWERSIEPLVCPDYDYRCLKFVTKLIANNPSAFPNLEGLRIFTDSMYENLHPIKTFCNLKHLYLRTKQYLEDYETNFQVLDEILRLLVRNAHCLETLDYTCCIIGLFLAMILLFHTCQN